VAGDGSWRGRIRAFRYAFSGLRLGATEPNFRIQLTIGIAALILAGILRVGSDDWLAIIVVSVVVLVTEMVNTAIEAVVDLASPEYSATAKIAKDVAAGAVLLASIGAVVVGLYAFVPPLARVLGI